MFDNIDMNDFWDSSSEYDHLRQEPFSEEKLREIEREIGYKLPESYVALLRIQNGGCPKNKRVGNTIWVIDGIYGINNGDSEFWENEGAAYPKIGVPVCLTDPDICSTIFLDYRKCGNDGEPRVVEVDTEMDSISFIAKDFETFVNMLVPARYNEDHALIDEETDPYEGVPFEPVQGEQKEQLERHFRYGFKGVVIITAFLLLLILVLHVVGSGNFLLSLLRIAAYIAAGLGIFVIAAEPYFYKSQCKKTYESYVDIVDSVWEENERIDKVRHSDDKPKFAFRLKISKADSYPNTDGFKEGDRIRVYRANDGEIILLKEQKQGSETKENGG